MNPDLTIAQARSAKAKLEKDICKLLHNFSRETGARVEDITIEWMEIFGTGCRYNINAEIKL